MKESKKTKLQSPRGMRDFVGAEYKKRKNFFSFAEKTAEKYGFVGIETPILEHTEIFLKGVGEGTDIVSKEMYNLKTEGGDKLTLRPEGTAGIMRAYIEHGMVSLPQPVMLYYGGPFFRHEKPQKGRYRQLYQFGLEILGTKNPVYDALIIYNGYKILKKSGNEIIVELNSIGTSEERENFKHVLKEFYEKHSNALSEEDRKKIHTNPLRILDSKDENTRKLNEQAPKISDYLSQESKEHVSRVREYLESLSVPYEMNNSLVRGLDYYSHTVFEYVTKNEDGEKSFALGGGGRYDGLAETLGYHSSVPSVGLGLGVDRILEKSVEGAYDEAKDIKVFIATNNGNFKETLLIAKELEELPLVIKANFSTQQIDKQYKKAKKLGFDYFLVKENTIFKLKNLRTGEEKMLHKDELKRELL